MSLSTPTVNRLASLDFVRGIAILLVMGWHFEKIPTSFIPFQVIAYSGWTFGWAGVDLFFVLSGFLVGGLLFKELRRTGKFDAKRFLLRRGFKIWPQYYIFILFVLLLKIAQHQPFDGFLWQNLFHVQNYTGTDITHTWSLAVEEHFYLVLALGLGWITTKRPNIDYPDLSKFLIAVIIVGNVLRLIMALSVSPESHQTWWSTHTRVDSLTAGVWLAATYHYRPELFAKIGSQRLALSFLAIAGYLTLALVPKYSLAMATAGLTMAYVAAGAFLMLVFSARPNVGFWGKFGETKIFKATAAIGVYSYGIYLWHTPPRISERLIPKLHLQEKLPEMAYWLVANGMFYAEAIIVGVVMTRLIEWPFLKLRDRLMPSRVAGALSEKSA